MRKAKTASFEDNYKRLEELVTRLDAGNLPLDESVALYEEGMQLAQACEEQLDKAEIRVTTLFTQTDKANTELEV